MLFTIDYNWPGMLIPLVIIALVAWRAGGWKR